MAPLLLFLIGPWIIQHPKAEAFGSRRLTRLTYMMFFLFFVGIIVALARYDPSLEVVKAGRFKTLLGLPIRFLIAGYRMHTVAFLILAFALPLHYYIDRKLFLQCLVLCWVFSVVHAVCGMLNYFGVYNLGFSYMGDPNAAPGAGTVAVLGFLRASNGLILLMGAFMSFAVSQLTRSRILKGLVYASMPVFVMATLFTWSRATMLAIVVAAISLAGTLGGFRGFLKAMLVAVIGVVVVVLVGTQIYAVQERFLIYSGIGAGAVSLEEASAGRITGWMELLRWIAVSPGVILTGVGFQNFEYFVKIFAQVGTLAGGHNNWLHILIEFGILGFVVFNCWLLAIFFWLVSWKRTMTNRVDRMMPGIFISLMFGMSASCLTQSTFAPASAMVPWFVHFFIVLGIWISYYRTQMLESYVDLESFDGEQYAYDEYDFAGEVSCDADQYSYNY